MLRMLLKLVILAWLICIGTGVLCVRIKREPGAGFNAGANAGGEIGGFILAHIADKHLPVLPETYRHNKCAYKYGCHKGYCWAGCDATAFNNEWCYTTRGYSQDFGYVRCSSDRDCDECWSCAGSCSV